MIGDWGRTLGQGLSQCKNLATCKLTLNIYNEKVDNFLPGLLEGVVKGKSLCTLKLEVNYQRLRDDSFDYDFSKLLDTISPFLSFIELTVSFYGSIG